MPFAIVLLAVAVIAGAAIWSGFVLSILWRWFMVGTFGLPPLGIAQAIGVSLVIAMLTHQMPADLDDDTGIKRVTYEFLAPLIVLAVGWVVKAFI